MSAVARAEWAWEFQTHRETVLKDLARTDCVMEYEYGPDGPDFLRVVLVCPNQLDKLLHQLTADRVTPEEALNPTLIWPK